MTGGFVDLTTPQPAVSVQAAPAPQPRRLGIRDLLERLAATAGEQAAVTPDGEQKQKLERVARLALELNEALSEVEVRREPGGQQPT